VYSGIEAIERGQHAAAARRGAPTYRRLFKNLVAEENGEASEIARRQYAAARKWWMWPAKHRADEKKTFRPFMKTDSQVKAPLMIDTTDPRQSSCATYSKANPSSIPSTWKMERKI